MSLTSFSHARLPTTLEVDVLDEFGQVRRQAIAAERALTLYLNKREIVTLMTLGADPEALVVGYLRNQGLLPSVEDLEAVQVDWEVEAAAVVTRRLPDDMETRLGQRTVTTGCGQGTVFGRLLDTTSLQRMPETRLSQSVLYALLERLGDYNETYRNAGAVHGCALCRQAEVLDFVEDVGRHNAVDTLAGRQWLETSETQGCDIFYTTGRLTSEMVLKVAQMGISVLVSRSGVTQKGVELAERFGVLLIARAKGRHFQAINAGERLELDAMPARRPGDRQQR
ncbi:MULTISPECIES: formate dehydrogenase accessory sulfurtransferase FdhD [Halomonas]|uniref:Sulfur carrier protein FdhD n=1 Tax=Halomonas chromatireducens TaxID=507626 RepID=A0A0X8HEL4_9GAMM|nr:MULTISPECIES: formate dehydrogenase accessory sulfurtransferase FdhD [Halomonas]AMD01165.1 formate dehydrogenase accessory protein [Halomonas chromatireducens]MBZ0330411.1 formate dehydrogenase accessory sulfurtransferase FdhD [Halomonas sp. ANAO-440]